MATRPSRLLAADVVRIALASSVARFDANEPMLWTDRDPEAVHQARVATRRLRSDLGTLHDFVDKQWSMQLRAELRWLGAELGGVRDVEVLHARLTLLNAKNEVVARLGDDVARVTGKDGGAIRGDKNQWQPGKFVHPHDACFGHDGSIFVAEWVGTGRVSKLKRLA